MVCDDSLRLGLFSFVSLDAVSTTNNKNNHLQKVFKHQPHQSTPTQPTPVKQWLEERIFLEVFTALELLKGSTSACFTMVN
ncbi:hypothetical protein L2E82_02025 [Cichorium intybus]|uniref:Uncharacterized protein n=1 Tax=Cichorium intybus TaxID=13427 RepID=A0ACB9H051_CICIN|nr:hypothetical protein L2E82_02025 [Cichorium intybus]